MASFGLEQAVAKLNCPLEKSSGFRISYGFFLNDRALLAVILRGWNRFIPASARGQINKSTVRRAHVKDTHSVGTGNLKNN